MLKFSCADFTFPVLERAPALKLVKLLGFGHVDIGLFARSSHFSPLELLRASAPKIHCAGSARIGMHASAQVLPMSFSRSEAIHPSVLRTTPVQRSEARAIGRYILT
jgi:hypothetical protein